MRAARPAAASAPWATTSATASWSPRVRPLRPAPPAAPRRRSTATPLVCTHGSLPPPAASSRTPARVRRAAPKPTPLSAPPHGSTGELGGVAAKPGGAVALRAAELVASGEGAAGSVCRRTGSALANANAMARGVSPAPPPCRRAAAPPHCLYAPTAAWLPMLYP
eukprot:scaffold20857_cov62-Phaeocystis_antarctica.AAC.1